jgi:hypothetical protein
MHPLVDYVVLTLELVHFGEGADYDSLGALRYWCVVAARIRNSPIGVLEYNHGVPVGPLSVVLATGDVVCAVHRAVTLWTGSLIRYLHHEFVADLVGAVGAVPVEQSGH